MYICVWIKVFQTKWFDLIFKWNRLWAWHKSFLKYLIKWVWWQCKTMQDGNGKQYNQVKWIQAMVQTNNIYAIYSCLNKYAIFWYRVLQNGNGNDMKWQKTNDKWIKHLYKWQWWANMNEYAIIQSVSEYAINNKVNMPSVLWKLLCQMNKVYILNGNGNENKMANEQDSKWWLNNMPSIQSVSKYAINNEYICHLQFQNKYANKS